MIIFVILALALPAYFLVCGLVHTGHIKPNKFTKYAGINMITENKNTTWWSIMGKLKVRISLPRNEQSYGKKMMFDEAVRFYAKEIMGSRLANLCTIKVHFRKYVSRRKVQMLEVM